MKPKRPFLNDLIEHSKERCGKYIDVLQKLMYSCNHSRHRSIGMKPADVNFWMYALFPQVEVYLSNKLVTPSSTSYPYRAYMETVLNFGKDAKASHLTSALFYKDQAGKMDAVNPLAGAADVNKGLKQQRHTHASESESVAMEGRIHSDLFALDRYIIRAVPIKIKLVRPIIPLCLVSSAGRMCFAYVVLAFRLPQS